MAEDKSRKSHLVLLAIPVIGVTAMFIALFFLVFERNVVEFLETLIYGVLGMSIAAGLVWLLNKWKPRE